MHQQTSIKIITPGHRYELENFEAKAAPGQILQFIEKGPPAQPPLTAENATNPIPYPATLITYNDGTTNEELLRVLIDRMNSLQAKFPYWENAIATNHFETGLLWLEKCAADRLASGVEGKHLK